MVTRTSTKHIIFGRPFSLAGFDSAEPAGTYTVDTEEELLETLSFPAWKRIATTIRITQGGTTEYRPVDPDELNGALARDATPRDLPVPHNVPPSAEMKGY